MGIKIMLLGICRYSALGLPYLSATLLLLSVEPSGRLVAIAGTFVLGKNTTEI